MRHFVRPLAACLAFGLVAGSATAGIVGEARYVGAHSADPEKETFGYVIAVKEPVVGFVGPARAVGPVTGDAEKDTLAYRPLIIPPGT